MPKNCATSLSSMRIGIICGMVQFTKRFGTMADRTLGRVTVRHAAAAAVGVAPGAGGVGYGTAVEEFGSPAIGFAGNERTCSPRVLQRTSRSAVNQAPTRQAKTQGSSETIQPVTHIPILPDESTRSFAVEFH